MTTWLDVYDVYRSGDRWYQPRVYLVTPRTLVRVDRVDTGTSRTPVVDPRTLSGTG